MKITRFETFLVSHGFQNERGWWGDPCEMAWEGTHFHGLILRVHTDAGITGLGEASPWWSIEEVERLLHGIEPRFIGQDPMNVRLLTTHTQDHLANRALSAIDVALWDIVGKLLGVPVYRLLAQDGDIQNEAIRTYASGGVHYRWPHRTDQLIEEALFHKERGFTAMKLRIGSPWEEAGTTLAQFEALLRRLRAAVGDEMELMLDANQRFKRLDDAIYVAELIDELGFEWFEDPVSHYGEEGVRNYRTLQERVKHVAISGGEGYHHLQGHQEHIRAKTFDIVHIDATFLGLTQAYRLARIYHDMGRPCIPHSWTHAIAHAANAHLVAAIPNRVVLETQQINNPLLTDLVDHPIPVDRGFVDVPERPGLGIALREDVVRAKPFLAGRVSFPLVK